MSGGLALLAASQGPIAADPSDPQFRRQRNDPMEERLERRREKERNRQRHESLKRDTDKLLELAQELKEHVDNSSENTLSLDVIRKAEEVEKLARQVRNKMRQ